MIEPLFGSAAPMWPAVPYPGVGWLQGPLQPLAGALPFVNRPPVSSVEAMPASTAPALVAIVAMRRGQPSGPTTDQDIEDFIFDTLELLPSTSDVEVRCDGGRVTLAGTVHHKRLKREVGEIAWSIPTVNDVQNNVAITARRRARSGAREAETPAPVAARK